MSDVLRKLYKDIYEKPKDSGFAFGDPDKELSSFINSLNWKKANILDAGCGDGRNSIFLASKGFNVLGIDDSIVGLNRIKEFSKDSKISKNISLKEANLKTVKLKKDKFDFIISTYVLHELGKEGIKKVIKKFKSATKPGGINYLVFFTPYKGTSKRRYCYYPSESEIIKQYKGWKIIKEKKIFITHSHLDPHSKGRKIKHKHRVCYLFLQKPRS